jgi:hypothetical protein
MTATARLAALLSMLAILGGCAFGRTYSYSDVPIGMQGVSSAGTVAVGVQDARPYVVSGNKGESFVGLMRGGFGNPFDVNTQSGGPLAVEIRDAIVRSLKARGVAAAGVAIPVSDSDSGARQRLEAAEARRLVLVTLREWKSDTMMSTDLHYDLALAVYDDKGNALATHSIHGMDNLGNLGLSPNEGISRASAKKLDALFDDDKVLAALQ